MLRKLTIKNPGCQFCRYFIPVFKYRLKDTREACSISARRIYQIQIEENQESRWKWSDCDYAAEKNKNRLCADFIVKSWWRTLALKLILKLKRAEVQLPPTFKREIWWND